MLCCSLLPRAEVGVVEQHMKEQHRVFTNLSLVVGASRLEASQLELVMGVVRDIDSVVENLGVKEEGMKKDDQKKEKVSDIESYMDVALEELDNVDFTAKDKPQKVQYKTKIPKRAKVSFTFISPEKDKEKDNKQNEYSWDEPELGACVCPICPNTFIVTDEPSEKVYKSHVFDHKVTKWDCYCGVKFDGNILKKLHIYTVHRGKYHCTKCSRAFKEEDLYTDHMNGHDKSEELSKIICDDCGFTAKTEILLGNHKAYKHDTKTAICDVCAKKFPGRLKMMIHKRRVHIHGGKKQCPHCGNMISQLRKHIKIMHTDDKKKLHSCSICGRGFIDITRLNCHMRSAHTKEKPFPCRFLCGASCAEAGNRKKHEVTKHGEEWSEKRSETFIVE